jgi:hypothetical protein
MTPTNCLVVNIPTMSKALLMDMLGGLAYTNDRIKVAEESMDGSLACDPATATLIGTAGMAVIELIKLATSVYLTRKKDHSSDKPVPVHVTVHLSLGGKKEATVTRVEQLDRALAEIDEYAAVARVELV